MNPNGNPTHGLSRHKVYGVWDAINNDGNYEPENCRWATASQNQKNKRNKATVQSEYAGVDWDKQSKCWRIRKGGFLTEDAAFAALCKVSDASSQS